MSQNLEIKKQNPIDKVSNKLIKLGAFIGQQKHFSAIRDAFGAFLPLLIVGAMAVMINSVFISESSLLASLSGAKDGNALFESWKNVAFYISPLFNGISTATMSLFAVYISFLLGFFLMGSYGGNRLMGGLISLASFMLLGPIAAGGMGFLGAKGIIFAMLAGLTSPMLLWRLQNIRALTITMPEGVPPVVATSLNLLFPFAITIFVFGLIQPIWGGIMFASGPGALASGAINPDNYYFINWMYAIIVKPFMSVSQSWVIVFIVLFLVGLFWFFGVHGNNVMGPFVNAFWTTATISNVALYGMYGNDVFSSHWGELQIWTEQTMNSFALMGGASSTLGLLIGLSIFSKIPEQKTMSTIATPPAIFNISEPTLFGIPVVLNPIYFIPFIFTGAIQGLVAYGLTAAHIVNPTVVMVPWTAPIFLSGFLATVDPLSILLTAINLAIAIFMFLPFALMDIRTQMKVKAIAAEMELEDYKISSGIQIDKNKAENKINKTISSLEFKAENLEKYAEQLNSKIENLNNSLEERLNELELSKEYSTHNIKVYKELKNQEKLEKEEAKISRIDGKKNSIENRFKTKIEKTDSKLTLVNKEIKEIEEVLIPKEEKIANKQIQIKFNEIDKKWDVKVKLKKEKEQAKNK